MGTLATGATQLPTDDCINKWHACLGAYKSKRRREEEDDGESDVEKEEEEEEEQKEDSLGGKSWGGEAEK